MIAEGLFDVDIYIGPPSYFKFIIPTLKMT